VVIAVNARSFISTVIDSQGSVRHFAPPNAAYTMDGTGKGQEQGFPGSSTSLTVTFQKAGTYSYICGLHPWMIGSVVVKYRHLPHPLSCYLLVMELLNGKLLLSEGLCWI
jgi:hypothetical protein